MFDKLKDTVENNVEAMDQLYEKFIRQIEKWGSYALTQIGLGLIGDKGLSKVSKVATTANLTKGMSKVTNSATYRNTLNALNNFNLNIGNRFAYAGFGGSSLKSSFINTYQTAKDKLSPYQYTKRTTDGDIFVGKLYGEDVILKDVKVDEITYSKRTREEAEQLRKEFDRSVRKDFLKSLVNDPVKLAELKNAGILDGDIELMKRGKPIIVKEFPHVPKEHGFSDIVDNYSRFADEFPLVGGDRISRRFFQIEGSNGGKKGVFEWIVEPNGNVSHRRFIENGTVTGKPNQVPKK
ncbi:hypothetical protein [Bacillus mycoides]|uniref:hypothetical protein n=1 Tax=Bacillus mycoides TaxID=1405 RepID=UPI001F36BC51|nr:hypothetical protein [Bacillus mycoides]